MRPVLLEISGLNSFRQKQTIDFTSLTKFGIFGIFGPTGSGKSSILDGIIYAIFGKTPRGADLKSIINKDMGEVKVRYIFSINGSISGKYEIQRRSKVSKSGNITSDAKLTKILEDSKEIISDSVTGVSKALDDIIGLNFDEFTKTVVLPQGQFSKFLLSQNKNRKEILESIFSLEKYGTKLDEQISNEKKLLEMQSQSSIKLLSKYEDVNEENIKVAKQEMEKLSLQINKLRDKQQQESKKFQEGKILFENLEKLKRQKIEKKELEEKSEEMEELETEIKSLKSIEKISPDLEELKPLKGQINIIEKNINEWKKTLDDENTALSQLKEERQKIEEDKSKIPDLKLNFDKLQRLYKDKIEEEKLNEKIGDIKAKLDEKQKNIAHIEENSKANREKILEIENSTKDKRNIVKILTGDFKKNQRLTNAYNSLKDLNKREENIEVLEKSLNIIDNDIKTLIEDGAKLNEKIKSIDEEIEKISEEEIPEEFRDENYIKLHRIFSQNLIILEKKEETELEIKKISDELKDLENEDELNKKNLEIKNENLKNINLKIENMGLILSIKSIRDSLKDAENCPVCGNKFEEENVPLLSTYDTSAENEKKSIEEEISILKNKYEKTRASLEIKRKIREEKSLSLKDFPQEILKLNLKEYKNEFEDFEKKYKEAKENQNIIEEKKKNIEIEKNKLEIEVRKKREEYSEINGKKKSQEEEKNRLLKEIGKIKGEIESFKKENEVLDIKSSYDEMIENHQKSKKIIETIEREEKTLIELKTAQKSLEEEEKKEREGISSLKGEFSVNEGKLESVKKSIENSSLKDLEKTQIEYKKREIEEKIEEIEKTYEKVKEKFDEKTKIISKLSLDIEKNQGQRLEKKERFEVLKNKIDDFKKLNSYDNIDSIYKKTYKLNLIPSFEKKLEDYRKRLSSVEEKFTELENIVDGKNIDEVQLKILEEDNKNILLSLEENLKKEGELGNKIKKLQEDFEEKIKITKENEETLSQLDTIYKLQSLLKGKKYVQFLAKYNLDYVCKSASKLLLEMSRGSFELVMDSEGEFLIRDYKSGGITRSPQTLSGGEIFLVSMALALALSTKIQLGAKAVLEFFFLDEGFGTLDDETLNSALDTLDRVKNKNLSIGIISHVEKIKNFVPVKLEVSPANMEKGSRVNITL